MNSCKPNQIIDEIQNVIYPPAEAIVPQLYTIKSVAAATIRMYEATEDIHSIFPNLDMMQRAIDYLRGAPLQDEMKPTEKPVDMLNPTYNFASKGLNITSSFDDNGEYNIDVVGIEVESDVLHPELFGEMDFDAIEMNIEIPVICGKGYIVEQCNPILKYYEHDPNVSQLEDGTWVKEKEYTMDEDNFTYAFLLGNGRSKVQITMREEGNPEPFVFNITSHIHFKAKEPSDNEDTENE